MESRYKIVLVLVVLVTAVTWSRVVLQHSEFIFDDRVFIVHNTASWAEAFTQDSYTAAGYTGAPSVVYRPLGVMMMVAQRGLFGVASTRPWHGISLVAHLLNVLLLLFWLRGLRIEHGRALAASLLWAVSPLHAEAIAWSAGQFDLISAVFTLGALASVSRGRWPYALLGLGLFGVSIAIKETMVAALPALVITAWIGAGANSDKRATPPRHLYAGGIALPGLAFAASLANLRSAAGVETQFPDGLSLAAIAASIGGALLRGLGLAGILDAAGPPLHTPNLEEGLAIGAALLVLAAALYIRPGVGLAIGSLLLLAVPSLVFGQLNVSAQSDPDRYFYLAFAAVPALVFVVAAGTIRGIELGARLQVVTLVSIGLLCAWMSIRAVQEIGHWRDFEAVLERQVEIGRESAYVFYLLGHERLESGRACEAERDLARCMELEDLPGRRRQCEEAYLRARGECSSRPTPRTPSAPH